MVSISTIARIKDLSTIGNDTFIAEGTYGYGDIVGAVAYALKNKYKKICFLWFNDRKWCPPDTRYHKDDPETVLERTNYIVRKMSYDIEILHFIKETFVRPYYSYKKKHDKTLYSFIDDPEDYGHIALWTSKYNVDQLRSDPLREFKDPIHHDKIINALKILERPIEFVSYREPIHHTFEKIRTASICIGYEGMGQLIAKNYYKPMITFSRGIISKSTTGKWGMITDSLDDRIFNIEEEIKRQREIICRLTER